MNKIKSLVIISTFMLFPLISNATVTRFSSIKLRPATDNGEFATIQTSNILNSRQWSVGTAFDFGYKPTLGRGTNGSRYNIVESYLAEHFYGGIGIADVVNFSLDFPVAWFYRYTDPDKNTLPQNRMNIGDLWFSAKVRLLNRDTKPIGLSIMPFVTIPNGDDDEFIGNEGATGGGLFILDKEIGNFTLALNTGAEARKTFDAYGLEFGSKFLLGFGLSYTINKTVSVYTEFDSQTPLKKFYKEKSTSPFEGRAGVQLKPGNDKNIVINLMGGGGLNNGNGTPQFRLWASLGYIGFIPKKEPKVEEVQEQINVEMEKLVYFDTDKTNIKPKEAEVLNNVADILKQNPWIKNIEIVGHTDNIATLEYNQDLGMRRAKSVGEFLKSLGVTAEMKFTSFGETKPIDTNSTPEGRSKNRRVEIIVDETKPAN